MWYFEDLHIKNLMSHSDSKFRFNNEGLVLIFGKNEDDASEGANSNGSGKSAIIEGIVIGLTGEPYRDINNEDLIKDGENFSSVVMNMNNPVLKRHLKIEWIFERKKSAVVNIYVNKSKNREESIVSVADAKKFILEEIGISKEDLLNYFIINQGNRNSFFSSTDAKQKEMISRITNFKIIDSVIEQYEKERLTISRERDSILLECNTHSTKIETYEALLQEKLDNHGDEDLENLKQEKLRQIDSLEKEQSQLENDLTIESESLEELKKQYVDLKSEIEEDSKFVEQSIQLKKEIESLEDEVSSYVRKVNNLKTTKEDAITCPNCDHKFILDQDLSVEEIDDKIKNFEDVISDKRKELVELKGLFEDLRVVLEDYQKKSVHLEKTNRFICKSKDTIEDLNTNISRVKKSIVRLKNEVEELCKDDRFLRECEQIQIKIDEQNSLLRESKKNLLLKDKEIEDKDFWIYHLGRKGLQTYLTNKSVVVIQNLCNQYLEQMKVNLRVKISGYKTLANGELREKIEVKILKNGVDGKFARYSGGQKERINLAGILTFHNLINNSLPGRGINLLCLDESLDHLDENGKKSCLKILQNFDLTTLTISHDFIEKIVEDYEKVCVVFRNNNSEIIQNESGKN